MPLQNKVGDGQIGGHIRALLTRRGPAEERLCQMTKDAVVAFRGTDGTALRDHADDFLPPCLRRVRLIGELRPWL